MDTQHYAKEETCVLDFVLDRLLKLKYLVRLYEVSGDSSSLHVTSFETEARQGQEQSQLSLEPRQKIAPSHVREKPCQNKRTLRG